MNNKNKNKPTFSQSSHASAASHASAVRKPTCNDEQLAVVVRMLGGNVIDAMLASPSKEVCRCRIRGKFMGRNKRKSLISIGTAILIGSRGFGTEYDVLEVYESNEINHLGLPMIQLVDSLIGGGSGGGGSSTQNKKNKNAPGPVTSVTTTEDEDSLHIIFDDAGFDDTTTPSTIATGTSSSFHQQPVISFDDI
jgi:hypothetical protein